MAVVEAGADLLDAFASETRVEAPKARTAVPPSVDAFPPAARWAAVILLTVAATAGAMWALQQRPVVPPTATLTIQTTPPGAEVTISGKPSGISPVSLSLPAGEYQVVLSGANGQRRELAVTLTEAGSVVQHVEMGAAAAAAAPTAETGALRVETDPAGQTVTVDGTPRGVTPLTIPLLAPGEHAVVVRGPAGAVRRTVVVQRGETMSLMLAPTAAAPTTTAGWVAFDSPIVLQLREDGQLIGTTETARLMLPAGDHELEMSNAALGFSTTRRVSVAADRTTNLAVSVPNGTLSINAVPWAEVFIAGERIGETPIANISRPIGTHEVILRHPQLGERRATITVSTKQTARLGVDMRKR
jgi:hypothetical protein